jgi:hypothetical protein
MPTPTKTSGKGRATSRKATAYKDLPIVGAFKVLRGKHIEGGMVYETGEVVESKTDLFSLDRKKFGRVAKRRKAAELAPEEEEDLDEETTAAEEPDLSTMTVSELKAFATDRGLSVRSNATKAELINAIQSADEEPDDDDEDEDEE